MVLAVFLAARPSNAFAAARFLHGDRTVAPEESQSARPPAPRGGPGADESSPSGRIRGRVMIGDSMQPARRATVRLTSSSLREPRAITTDLEGRFDFTLLPPGRYSVAASKAGYLGLAAGQTRPSMAPQSIRLADRQEIDSVALFIFRGGAVEGRVVDEFGEPLANASVTVLQSLFRQGRRRLVAAGQRAQTNDLGEYRVFALTPGLYVVSASVPPGMPETENASQTLGEDPSGMAPVFFPGTTELAEATPVTVSAGQTVSSINLAMLGTRLARVSGMAVDRQGAPIASGSVSAIPRGRAQNGFSRSAALRPDGQFRITGLAPGDYTLVASARVAPPAGGATAGSTVRPETSIAIVTIDGNDIDGVRLTPLVPGSVRGRIVFDDGGDVGRRPQPASVRVLAEAIDPDDAVLGQFGVPAEAGTDFRFTLQVPPVALTLRAITMGASGGGWFVSAVRASGVDITESGFVVKPGEGLSGVEIELTSRPTEVHGLVAIGSTLAPGTFVAVFPEDPARWSVSGQGAFQLTRTNDVGRYLLRGLRPGRYFAVAVPDIDEANWMAPEFLETIRRDATAFALTRGEEKQINLRARLP
ncbi:collagen binding domain-containing protein [Luteitalea sp.]|uniref:MSCRAMM family protein n=1 Tax=Luteitalea sp. TaxID=2004800 RepID=UPI0025C586F6|nr:carboxypeptidase-like regulatory domain-containing protein [Luteitalea sp.]